MLVLKLAFRTIMRRKARMALIGSLVAFGSFLLAFGGIFAGSAAVASRDSIIHNFTGDFIVYSAASRDLPSPFAFNTPLPVMRNSDSVSAALSRLKGVDRYTFYAQNYAILEAERGGRKVDLPFIFYAIEPESFRRVFDNVKMRDGSFFGSGDGNSGPKKGVLISDFQAAQYEKNYGVRLASGEQIKLLGLTEFGVNTVSSSLVGVFNPIHYTSVFNYINLMDEKTYAALFNYTGVESLPKSYNAALASADSGDEGIFALAGSDSLSSLDLTALKSETLSGYTMAAVRMKDHKDADAAMKALSGDPSLGVKVARWDAASGFYAKISAALQAFIFIATGLIFLVVVMIFMNTLIINVVERTGEIGTMRALGAEKSFVRSVLVAETLLLNIPSSMIGMLAAAALYALTKGSGFPLPESVSQFLIGGGPLPLVATAFPFALAFLSVLVVSVLATVYPASVASSIAPQEAMAER
jgi:putative ABC transport system permease protein